MDMTGHRLLLYDHPYVPEIGVPSQHPQGFNEEARYNPAIEEPSAESSGNSQQADHRCETPWAQSSDVAARKCASWL
jgi:hypothetical protein